MKIAKQKFVSNLREAKSAWGVLLLIIIYECAAQRFLGTSCLLASTVGIPCPGCGSTRAFVALLHGDIKHSLQMQPLLIPLIISLSVYCLLWFTHERTPKAAQKLVKILAVVVIAVYAVRMIMLFPHTPPMNFNTHSVLGRIINFVRNTG